MDGLPEKYNPLLKEVIVHETIHAYIETNGLKNELKLDHEPNRNNMKDTKFGNVGKWMNDRYPPVNDDVKVHRERLGYDKSSLDIGPQSQKFLQNVVPDVKK